MLREDGETFQDETPLLVKSRPLHIQRLRDRRPARVEALLQAARQPTDGVVALSPLAWTVDALAGPNVTDKTTVLSFAKMTANAYVFPAGTGNWEDVEGSMNYSNSFGWENDGLRGHIYADEGNATIAIVIKGTSGAVYDSAGTETNDKVNDNLFFSCCCGQGGHYLWRQACHCMSTTYTCNQTCLTTALRQENHYYRAALDLYSNVTALYPGSTVWAAGHSLGGSVSSLLGLTYGLPVVTFEAPGQALAAARLGLPSPPGAHPGAPQTRRHTGIYNFGHTADPVFMGLCNGLVSVCTIAGYAMETQCHTGDECVYDTVQEKGWRVGIGSHTIKSVIRDVIEPAGGVPPCVARSDCVDCFNWKYFESNGSEHTTTSKPTTTTTPHRTRTSTCKTPGWWGCLDESTTGTGSTSITTTSSMTTCHTPGWFGCNDPITTSSPTTSMAPTVITITTTPTHAAPRTTVVTVPPRASDTLPGSTRSSTTTSSIAHRRHCWFFIFCWNNVIPSTESFTTATATSSMIMSSSTTSTSTSTTSPADNTLEL